MTKLKLSAYIILKMSVVSKSASYNQAISNFTFTVTNLLFALVENFEF